MKKTFWVLLIFLMSSLLYAEKEYKPNCAVYSLHELMPHQPIMGIVQIFVNDYPSFKGGMGSNRDEIIEVAKKFGMVLQYRKCTFAELMTLNQPVIVSLKTGSVSIKNGNISITNHFVVVKKATEDKVFIISNSKEEIMETDKFIKLWAGYIIEKL
jgi:hypothetical protein